MCLSSRQRLQCVVKKGSYQETEKQELDRHMLNFRCSLKIQMEISGRCWFVESGVDGESGVNLEEMSVY